MPEIREISEFRVHRCRQRGRTPGAAAAASGAR